MRILHWFGLLSGLAFFTFLAVDVEARGWQTQQQELSGDTGVEISSDLDPSNYEAVEQKRKIGAKKGKQSKMPKSSPMKHNKGKKGKMKVDQEISIAFPMDGAVSITRSIQVTGFVEDATGEEIVATNTGLSQQVDNNGNFDFAGFSLVEGENRISVMIVGESDASDTVTAFYERPREASVVISPASGGKATVADSDSSVSGAGIDIPPGVATRNLIAGIVEELEHVPLLPFGFLAVSAAVTFTPEAEIFNGDITLQIPFSVDALPLGQTSGDIRVAGLSDNGWVEVPAELTADSNAMQLNLDRMELGPFVAFVEVILQDNEVLVETIPSSATIYVDGANTNERTPTILRSIEPGSHDIKLYLEGFDEVFDSFDSSPAGGVRIRVNLEEPDGPIPELSILSPLDGTETVNTFVEVNAQINIEGQPLETGKAVVATKTQDFILQVVDGYVSSVVPLALGETIVQVRATSIEGTTGVSETISVFRQATESGFALQGVQLDGEEGTKVRDGKKVGQRRLISRQNQTGKGKANALTRRLVSNQEIVATLSWNTDGTDIDVHIFDPLGNHAYYGDQDGIPGAMIDVDDVDGFGPEIFAYPTPVAGDYRITVDAYRISVDETLVPTTAFLTIRVGGDEIFSGSFTFFNEDFNSSDGIPGPGLSVWDAHSFTVGELAIVEIVTQLDGSSNRQEAVFTTADGENMITVTTEAPDSVADGEIFYEILETNSGAELDTSLLSGREITFAASHELLIGLTNPRYSMPIEFRIVAYTLDAQGSRDMESEPAFIKQDIRSQLRQEYIDKREILPSFARATPARSEIIQASSFDQQQSEYFTFSEFAAFVDEQYSGYAVIGESLVIANTLRGAWGQPLRITSGYRNPRRNDSLGPSSSNSYHQSGDAIDLNPSWNPENWPGSVDGCLDPPSKLIETYEDAQGALACLAQRLFPSPTYDAFFHANHVHIEKNAA